MAENLLLIGDSYTLSDAEREAVKGLATKRSRNNRRSGIPERGIGPSSGFAKDMLGMGGEWAFACLAGKRPDTTTHNRSYSKGQDGGDISYRGRFIDVKTTDHQDGQLVTVPWKGEDPKVVFALMVLKSRKPPVFEFRGFATPNMIKESPVDFGYGPTYAVLQDELLEWIHVPQFSYRCRKHQVASCLDCPDRFFD